MSAIAINMDRSVFVLNLLNGLTSIGWSNEGRSYQMEGRKGREGKERGRKGKRKGKGKGKGMKEGRKEGKGMVFSGEIQTHDTCKRGQD